MHAVVMESLEEFLAGSLEPAALRKIEAHLSTCAMCREEIRGMQDVSQMFGSLRPAEAPEPAPGFYARVMERAAAQSSARSLAGIFGLDLSFARRLAFACLLMVAVVGSYLITRETAAPAGPSPVAIFAQQDMPSFDSARAEDNMLLTLTAYDH